MLNRSAQQPGKPKPPGNPPNRPEPDKEIPIDEPPESIPVPPERDEPEPIRASVPGDARPRVPDLNQGKSSGDPLDSVTMDERVEALHRRIATYRRHLNEGVPSDIARKYLKEIEVAEAELTVIANAKAEPTKIKKDSDKHD